MPDQETGAIVVVEDDDGMRRAFERVLSAAGFHAVTFASAETLLHCHAADGAACIVLDIHLPGLSGFELRRELVRTSSAPPSSSSPADDRSARAGAAPGAAAFLPKLFAGRVLVGGHRARRGRNGMTHESAPPGGRPPPPTRSSAVSRRLSDCQSLK
jgi:FixJ family two-component response regulator